MLSLSEIRKKINEFGSQINAPSSSLIISDQAMSDATPYVEFLEDEYHYVVSERGEECFRKKTKDINQFLYWVFVDITSDMALSYELEHRRKNEDPRRLRFSYQSNLLAKIDPSWEILFKKKVTAILTDSPYDDKSSLRIKYSKELVSNGLAPEEAYSQATIKYPLP